MLVKDFDKALELAESTSPGGVFVVAGEEPYQSLRLEKSLETRAKTLGLEAARLSGDMVLPGVVKRLTSEGSLFSAGKFILIRNTDEIPLKAQQELVEAVSQKDSQHLFLLLTQKQSLNTAFLKKLGACATVFQCWEPFPGRMWPWTKRLSGEMRVRLDREASETVSALSFGKLMNLAGIIERISIRYGPDATVTSEMVLASSGALPECNALEMTNHAVSCRTGSALSMMSVLLSSGEEPIRLLALIHSQWVLAACAAGILEKGGGESQVAATLGISPYRVKQVLEMARFWRGRALAPVAMSFAETDMKLKRGWDSLEALASFIIALTLHGG
jgi:DNA polymerase III delta subunit